MYARLTWVYTRPIVSWCTHARVVQLLFLRGPVYGRVAGYFVGVLSVCLCVAMHDRAFVGKTLAIHN